MGAFTNSTVSKYIWVQYFGNNFTYSHQFTFITGIVFNESAKLCTLRALVPYVLSCPECLVPYVLACLTCFVHYVFTCPTCLVPYVLACPMCLVPYALACPMCVVSCVLACPTFLVPYMLACPTCSRAPRASCLTYIRVSCVLLFACFLPSVPYIHDKDNNVEMFSKYVFVLITFTLNVYQSIYPTIYLSIYLFNIILSLFFHLVSFL